MVDVRIALSGLWAAMMLTYLLGDVIRVLAGDFKAGEMGGQQASRWMWLLAVFLVAFNLVGLPYPGLYDDVLIVVSFVFNALIVRFAWTWTVA